MAWSDQQYPTPQNMPQGGPSVPGPGMSAAPGIPNGSPPLPANLPPAYGPNPLQPAPPAAAVPMPANPLTQPPMPMPVSGPGPMPPAGSGAVPMTAAPLPAVPASTPEDDKVAIDDVEWINRTKRAIAGSRSDPYRQVQLIQHLRSQYLKQRYGRTVHTDEG